MVSKNRKSRGLGKHVNNTNSELEVEQTNVNFDEADFLPNLRENFEAFNSESIRSRAKVPTSLEDLCPSYFFRPCHLVLPLPTLVRREKREGRYFAYNIDFRLINTLLGTHLYCMALDPQVASESNLIVTPHLLNLISHPDIKPLLLGVQLGIVGVWFPIDGTLDTELRLPKDARPHIHAMITHEHKRQDWMVRVNKQVRIQLDLKDTTKPLRLAFDPTANPYASHNAGMIGMLDAAFERTNNRALNSKSLKDVMKRRHGKKCICKDCRPAPAVKTVETKVLIDISTADSNPPEASTSTPLIAAITASKAEENKLLDQSTTPSEPEEGELLDESLIEGVQHMVKTRCGYTVSFPYAGYFLAITNGIMLKAAKAIDIDLQSREKLLKSTGRVDYCDLKGLAPSHGLVKYEPYCLDEIVSYLEMEDADIIDFQKAIDANNLACRLVEKIVEEEDENGALISVDRMKRHLVNLLKNTYFRRNREYYYQRRLDCKHCLKLNEEDFRKEMRKQDAEIERGMKYTDWSVTVKAFERYLKGKAIPGADVAPSAFDQAGISHVKSPDKYPIRCETHSFSSGKIALRDLARSEEVRELGYGKILEQCSSLMARNDHLVRFDPTFRSIARGLSNDIFLILDKGKITEENKADLEKSIEGFDRILKRFESQAVGPIEGVKEVPKPETTKSIVQQNQGDVVDLMTRQRAIGNDDEDEDEDEDESSKPVKPNEPSKPGEPSEPSEPIKASKSRKSRKPRKPKA